MPDVFVPSSINYGIERGKRKIQHEFINTKPTERKSTKEQFR